MLTALFSAAASFVLTYLVVLALLMLQAGALAWLQSRVLPRRQERMPRRIWIAGGVALAAFFGSGPALDAGLGPAVLSFGDTMAGSEMVVIWPLPGGSVSTAVPEARRATLQTVDEVRVEWTRLRRLGPLRYLIEEAGPRVFAEIGEVVEDSRAAALQPTNEARGRALWQSLRQPLRDLLRRRIVRSTFAGTLLVAGIALLGLLALPFVVRDARRAARARSL